MASSTLLTHCLVFFFFIGTAVSAPFISARIFEAESKSQPQESIGRSLLQAKDDCSINFEFLNYTVLTSECKGPQYLPRLCCPAFKKFACPAVDELNNLKSTCATTMFSYINLYGKYPPGLFSSECVEAEHGLDCKGYIGIKEEDKSAGSISQIFPRYLILAATSLVLLVQMF